MINAVITVPKDENLDENITSGLKVNSTRLEITKADLGKAVVTVDRPMRRFKLADSHER